MITLDVDRDSVHPADDISSHKVSIKVENNLRVEDLLLDAMKHCSLPSISEGKATWFAYSDAEPKRYLGVVAQQWNKISLLVCSSTTAGDIFSKGNPRLIFCYWCQADPDLVFNALSSGKDLPCRYS